MGVLDDVGTYMAANVTDVTLTLGTNLFLGRLPESPDTCVAIYETAGTAPTDVFGANTAPPIENAGVSATHGRRRIRPASRWPSTL